MSRNRSHTRRTARSNPRGRVDIRRGGYGFVATAEGEYFVPKKLMRGAFPGDLVEIAPINRSHGKRRGQPSQSGMKREARVVAVIEHAHRELVGYFRHAEPFGVVEPIDPTIQHDIFTQLSEHPEIPDGAVVRVAISTYPDRNTAATGSVVEVIGDEDDERVAIDMVVARHKLETAFSKASLAQADDARVDEQLALQEGYRDLRDRFIFTIDPADARDFDDAVSIEPVVLTNDGYVDAADDGGFPSWPSSLRLRTEVFDACYSGQSAAPKAPSLSGINLDLGQIHYWRVGVHIADVSHYVPWASSIDLDARRRATSVYLVDRVIPMLPEKLSNDICSLRPEEVRRTMTVDMIVNAHGEVVSAEVYPALIRSCARLTYEEAQRFLDAGRDVAADLDAGSAPQSPGQDSDARGAELQLRIHALSRIAKLREALREKAGGLDFDTVEAKVRLDADGHPVGVDLRQKTEATELIEEAMIMANEAVARFLRDSRFPCLYRVHEQPSRDALEGLVPALREFSWFGKVDEAKFIAGNPIAVQKALALCANRPEAELVTTLVLRSMKRAQYSPQNDGHYGLASEAYAHFTSPIRRYPDLVVHRMLKAALFGRPEKFDQEAASLGWISEHSSEMERVAEKAARESQEAKLIELMEEHVGETFSALISGVATFGLYVRLDNTAEGVVEIGDLGREYFILDPVRHMLIGSDTGKEYRLGRRVAVRLVEADCRMRKLRFRLAK